MEKSNICSCPLCNRPFIPTDGMTPDEFMAKNILLLFEEMRQDEGFRSKPICMRCGRDNIRSKGSRNALSRVCNFCICSECGKDEALQAINGNILPVTSWWVVTEVLKRKGNIYGK